MSIVFRNRMTAENGRMAQLIVPTGYFVEFPHGRMAQLVVPGGTNHRIQNVDVDGVLASR